VNAEGAVRKIQQTIARLFMALSTDSVSEMDFQGYTEANSLLIDFFSS
jgi:hypothetical protein